MFNVINKDSNSRWTVYGVRFNQFYGYTEFLIYKDEEWVWDCANDYEPEQ